MTRRRRKYVLQAGKELDGVTYLCRGEDVPCEVLRLLDVAVCRRLHGLDVVCTFGCSGVGLLAEALL